jgi:subtilisin family serine protease
MQPSEKSSGNPDRRLWALLIALLLGGWMSLAPTLSLAGGMSVFQYVPKSFEIIPIVPRPGIIPQTLIQGLIAAFAFLLQAIVFSPIRIATRGRPAWATLHAIAGGFLAAAAYLLVWQIAALPFADQSAAPSILRLAAAVVVLGLLNSPLQRDAPAKWTKPAGSTLLLAFGASALLLLPWMVNGALGTLADTLAALVKALSFGVGEELLLRGVVVALVVRAGGRPRLGFLTAILIGLAMQPGYLLPRADLFALFRVFNTVAVALLATEFAARGSLWSAILVHSAFEFGYPGWVDWRMQFSLPHPAALESLGVILALAAVFIALRWILRSAAVQPAPRLRLSVAAGFAVVALAGSATGYLSAGRPGLTQDGFLIVFRDQADVSAASGLTDRVERLTYVYQTLAAAAERSQAGARAELDRLGVRYRPHYLINWIEVYGRTDLTAAFAARPEVAAVLPNPNVRVVGYAETMSSIPISFPGQGPVEWNIRSVGAPLVWKAGVDGGGIVIGEADTGVDWTHPALQAQYRGWADGEASHDYNWFDAWDDTAVPWDDYGHGTYTLGTVLGREGTANQIGMAPGAKWIGCRNMRYGIGNPGAYLACLEFFLAPFPHGGDPLRDGKPELAVHIVNNSWGCPEREGCRFDTLDAAFVNLRAAGILMVAAAGNEGPACSTAGDPPANSAAVFSVGASDENGSLAFFSSRGPEGGIVKPDIVAPGWLVRSSIPGGRYTISQGTSISAPHVTGAAALLWSAFPALIGDIDGTIELLERTADPVTIGQVCGALADQGIPCRCGADTETAVPNNSFGYGILNVYAAYKDFLNRSQ